MNVIKNDRNQNKVNHIELKLEISNIPLCFSILYPEIFMQISWSEAYDKQATGPMFSCLSSSACWDRLRPLSGKENGRIAKIDFKQEKQQLRQNPAIAKC